MNFNPTVTPDDILMSSANGHGPRVCIDCKRAVGAWHGRSCHVFRQRAALAERKPKPARYRYAGLGLLLALALAGCEGEPESDPWFEAHGNAMADEFTSRFHNAVQMNGEWHISNPGPNVRTYEYWRHGRRDTVSIAPGYLSMTPVDSFRVVAIGEDARSALAAQTAKFLAESIAQADPRTEADWPRPFVNSPPDTMSYIAAPWAPADTTCWERTAAGWKRRDGAPAMRRASGTTGSLTVTNATPRTLLLEQAHVVTLARPGSTQTVALEGSVTVREEASYDE